VAALDDTYDDADFEWDELLDTIEDGKVVPVLGHELLEAVVGDAPTTLQRLLANRLVAARGLTVELRRHFELADAVAAMLEQPRVRPDDSYPQVNRLMRALEPPFPVPDTLLRLASIRPLDLFVSTTPDDLMARALDSVRHGGNALTRQIAFAPKQDTNTQTQAHEEPGQGLPVVFNLFGRFSPMPAYALHEEDALEFIHAFISRDSPPPDWLMSRLRDRRLLLLGVHLPDWLERFVLRGVNRGPLRTDRRTYWIARSSEPSAASVALFFQRFGRDARLHVYPGSAAAFVGELQGRWQARGGVLPVTNDAEAPAGPDTHKAIFISYDWNNRDAVERLAKAVDEASDGDCWLDRRNLLPGSTWEDEIRSAIRRGVKLFIAVLSDVTENKKGGEGVVFQEWDAALERARGIIGRDFVIPVVVDADATRADPARYPKLMKAFPQFERYTFGLAPGGVPSETLLDAIRAQLRAIRS
jgi:hypothetical protein